MQYYTVYLALDFLSNSWYEGGYFFFSIWILNSCIAVGNFLLLYIAGAYMVGAYISTCRPV